MRVIPYGLKLIEDGYSFEEAVKFMNADSALTHANETIFMANRFCLDVALHRVEQARHKEEYHAFLESCTSGHTAWVKHTLYTVIQALTKESSFLEGFKFIVSQGGDTDTNCAIYGAIKGYRENIAEEIDITDFLTEEHLHLISVKEPIK